MARHDDKDGCIAAADKVIMREMKKRNISISILLLLIPLVTIGYALLIINSPNNNLSTHYYNMTQTLVKTSNSSILPSYNSTTNTIVPVEIPDTALDDDDNNSSVKQQQIENYRKGDVLLINVHATHHAGTTFCGTIGRNGINHSLAPVFARIGDRDQIMWWSA